MLLCCSWIYHYHHRNSIFICIYGMTSGLLRPIVIIIYLLFKAFSKGSRPWEWPPYMHCDPSRLDRSLFFFSRYIVDALASLWNFLGKLGWKIIYTISLMDSGRVWLWCSIPLHDELPPLVSWVALATALQHYSPTFSAKLLMTKTIYNNCLGVEYNVCHADSVDTTII